MKKSRFKLFYAALADVLALEDAEAFLMSAKMADGEILFQYDPILLHENFNGVITCDTESFADLFGYYYPAKLVDVSYNTGRFHISLQGQKYGKPKKYDYPKKIVS